MSKKILAIALVLAAPVVSRGQLNPVGSEFQINTYTTSSQNTYGHALASSSTGDFVVVWHSFGGQDGHYAGILAQRYASDGTTAGTEFLVNTYTSTDQRWGVPAFQPNGDFVIVWTSGYGQDGEGWGNFGQRFASDGSTLGSEFAVNSYTQYAQQFPVVATDAAGNFVVVWTSYGYQSQGQDGDYAGIFGQRFASDGSQVGTEFQVNTTTVAEQYSPAVDSDANGNFVVVWNSTDTSDYGAFGQRFANTGTPVGTEFVVNAFTLGFAPDVVMEPDGDFVTVWAGDDAGGYPPIHISGRRYDSSGSPVGSEFAISTYTGDARFNPSITRDASGAMLVVWDDVGQDGDSFGVFGQHLDSSGAKLGTEFQVNTRTADGQDTPAVASTGPGRFVVVWNGQGSQDGQHIGMFGQLLEATEIPTAIPTPTMTATATGSTTATATVTATATPTTATAGCPMAPAVGCAAPMKGKLIVKDNADNSKDKLVWKFGKGPMLTQADFGNPVTVDEYTFCVYDDGTLKIDLTIPAGMPWDTLSTKGYQYKDSSGTNDGVTKIKLIGGDAGKSKLQLKGKGTGLSVPAAASTTQLFDASSAVVVQLHGSGACWETTFDSSQSTHKVNSYKGKF